MRTAAGATAAILKAIANEHRLLMLCALAEQPLAVCDLNRHVPLAQSALSQHLARLRGAGLVVTERDGPKIRYALADERTRRLIDVLCAEYGPPAPAPAAA
ncbi:ArsR/SmtB family transcription factor [Immundisolibacter sp.]|uniref:ArsR/SmtB family transcription factor n=1 Tax=Immundisolibacter sp. TaxID=1934948 RepID=UPI00356B0AE6